ncbi:MAG: alpha/beta hydrolase [Planctomycetota bacterium]
MNSTTVDIAVYGSNLEIALAYSKASDDLVLFIHGLGCCKESFESVWDRKDYRDYSLLAIDLAGFGESSKTKSFSYSMEAQAKVCEEVLKRFSFARLHIVAHSMGNAVGLLLPEYLIGITASFANVEGNLIAEDCGLVSRKTISVPFDAFEKDYLPYFVTQFQNEKHHHIRLDKTTAHAFYRSSKSLVEWSDSGQLLDRFLSLPCAKAYFHGDQNANLKTLPLLGTLNRESITGSGHFMMNDNADEFYSKLLKHLIAPAQS